MINFNNAEFIISSSSTSEHLYDYPQVLFIGKSNVGKSSLINALTNRKNLAYVSQTPGHTTLINYYLIDKTFYLVDAPGFGYRRIAYFQDDFEMMMQRYLTNHKELRLICYLIDSRRDIASDELETINFLQSLPYPYLIIFTKSDKLKQSELAKIKKEAEQNQIKDYLLFSVNNRKQINSLQERLNEYILK